MSVPRFERVEDRLLLATFVVTSTTDNLNAVSGDGTLRGEILASNATTTSNELDFSLPNGVQTIALRAPLPPITDTLFINGGTATGFSGAPLIQITGTNPTFQASGPAFSVNANGSQISDLIINSFAGDGIDVNATATKINGCYIGLDATGTKPLGNTQDGILVATANNTIGGVAGSPNVISANGGNAIEVNGNNAGNNLISGNLIGTNAAGTAAVFTGVPGDGIAISTPNDTIGGVSGGGTLGLGNLISGNQEGLELFSGANQDVVIGNFIGTDLTGEKALSNVDFGVYDNGGTRDTIGGLTSGDGNVVSGNGNDGVRIQGATSTGNLIQGNLIGVGADGVTPVGNGHWGVQVNTSNGNQVGGTTFVGNDPSYGNVIQHNDTKGGAGGVLIFSGINDGVLSNSIYQNGTGPGISLNGGNNGIKAPTLLTVQSGAGQTRVTGTFAGNVGTNYRLQFFSSPMPNASGTGDGQSYLLGDLPITTNSQGIANFSTTILPQVPVGYFLTATATQGVLTMNNTSIFSTAVLVTQAAVTDLAITTSVPATGPELDQPYKYVLTVTNSGPNTSTDAVVTDTLPANATVTSLSGGSVTGGVFTDDLGPLAAGASDTITILVKPTGTGTFTNTASVTGPQLDPVASNNTSTTTATVVPDSDLEVTLTPGVTLAPVGSPITYDLSIGNNGPSTATGTVVTIQLPADFTGIQVNADQGSVVISSSNLITISTGIVPASSASNVIITATPTAIESAVATATVASPVADPNAANNSASATVSVGNAADLGITIDASPNPALVGQALVYTVIVTNTGPSTATAPAVVDALPQALSFNQTASSAGPGDTLSFNPANNTILVSLAPLASGASDTLTFAVTPTANGLVTNNVIVGNPGLQDADEIDPDLTNNSASITVPVSPADLSVSVINPTDPLFVGSYAVFEVQVTNDGPSDATNVQLADGFIGGNIVQTSAGNFAGPNYGANLGTIPSGQTATVFFIVDPTRSGTLSDTAIVASDQYDPEPANNMASSSNLVSPADLSVAVGGSSSSVLLGNPLLYVVTVTNNGPAPATNVQFSDALPAGAILGGLVSSQGSVAATSPGGATLGGNLGTLAPGASAYVVVYVQPLATGSYIDSATASADNFDPNTANNASSFAIPVVNLPGTIQFLSTINYVYDTSGSVTLVLERTGGTLGAVSATYSTVNYTAVAGVNYVATTGTVNFAAGQTLAAVTIPVLDDFMVDGNHGFFVSLSNPTAGASIGQAAASGVVVVNTNRDLVPPVVTSLLGIPSGNSITGFALTFDKPLDPARASLLSNYFVFLSSNGAVNVGTPVALAAAEYSAVNNTVILVPTSPLPSNRFYEIVANGTVGQAITDTSGNVLAGSSGPGSNYIAYYGQGTKLVYDDSQNNVVTLNLTGGGIMGIYRSQNGDASLVNLYGVVPHSTKLTGSVKKLNKSGSGHTNIGAIVGLGQFGAVNSTLTTPQFYVGSASVSASSVGAAVPVPMTVSAESVAAAPAVTVKKPTPKGPHVARR